MKNYHGLFEHLRSNNSRLFKEAELEKHKDDELLKRILFMGLDPFTNYWIRKIPDYRRSEFGGSDTLDLPMALDELELLANRTYTGHAGVAHLKSILERLEETDDCNIIEHIIDGDFRCGVGTGTLNRLWPGLIFEFPMMLSNQFDKKIADNFTFPARVDLKMDGMRFCAIADGHSKISFHSRNGKQFDFLGNLEEEFKELAGYEELVFDGEIWVDDGRGKPLPRKIGNGICSKALKGTISEAEAALIRVTLWDRIPFDKWKAGLDTTPLSERTTLLEDGIKSLSNNKIQMIKYDIVENIEEAQEIFRGYLAQKEEGIILKKMSAPWEDKRSKHFLKFKAERDADLRCIGWKFGNGKNINKVGKLLLTTSDGEIETWCGSGMSDEDREKPGDWYLDKIVEIVYNERIKSSGDKKESLFLPIFITVREDKDVANSSKELS